MNYSIFLFSLVVAGSVQAQTCESSISPNTPISRFKLYNNGTAFDKKTGLTWMRCPLGQTWDSGTKVCSGYVTSFQWKGALDFSRSTNFAGFTDWRWPNIKELSSNGSTVELNKQNEYAVLLVRGGQ